MESRYRDNAADIISFINSIFLASTEGREQITESESEYTITQWKADGISVPAGLTGKLFCDTWNRYVMTENEHLHTRKVGDSKC